MNRVHAETDCLTRRRLSAIVLALGILLSACSDPPAGPEVEVRNWIDRGVAAAEAKDRRTLMNMISPAYADARGYNRARIGNLFRAYFLRMNSIELLATVNDIATMGDSAAEVQLTIGMAGTKDSLLGFSADAYQFSLELEKSAGDWLLISARWSQLGRELQ